MTTTTNNNNAGSNNMNSIKTIRFGIEIELSNITITRAAMALASVFGSAPRHGYGYSRQIVRAADGREWQAMSDASVHNGCEVVSPILTYSDIETVQEVVRALRRAGARAHGSCGIHIHIDGAPFKNDPKALVRLAKLMNMNEDILFAALGTSTFRRYQSTCGCRDLDQRFFAAIKDYKGANLDEIKRRWYRSQGYNESSATGSHYNNTRYSALNLHSLFYRGTVEFRWFETSTHAGVVKAYLQLTLALAAKALDSKRAVARKRTFDPNNARYDVHHLLHSLRLTGDEFKTCRLHLTKHLPGGNNGRRQAATETAAA